MKYMNWEGRLCDGKVNRIAQLTTDNSLAGNLVKAQCEFCGNKFGSIEEARKCESGHIMGLIGKEHRYDTF